MAALGVVQLAMVWRVHRAALFREGTPPDLVARMVRGVGASLPAFLVWIPVAFADPSAAKWVWLYGSLAVSVPLRIARLVRRRRSGR